MFLNFLLSDAEKRYSVLKLETLVILKSLDKLRWICQATFYPIRIYTNHLSIIQLWNNKSAVHKKLYGWIERIIKYNIILHHLNNTTSVIAIADRFSRFRPPFQNPPPMDPERIELWVDPPPPLWGPVKKRNNIKVLLP